MNDRTGGIPMRRPPALALAVPLIALLTGLAASAGAQSSDPFHMSVAPSLEGMAPGETRSFVVRLENPTAINGTLSLSFEDAAWLVSPAQAAFSVRPGNATD